MTPRPEFSRPVTVATLKPGGEAVTLTATEAERQALARRLGVEGVREVEADLRLTPRGKGMVAMRGRLRATLDRLCVVSLEPIEERIDERLSILFRPEDSPAGEVELDAEAEDEEPYEGGSIDLGEAVAQTLALVMDPWPRAPGAEAPPHDRF